MGAGDAAPVETAAPEPAALPLPARAEGLGVAARCPPAPIFGACPAGLSAGPSAGSTRFECAEPES